LDLESGEPKFGFTGKTRQADRGPGKTVGTPIVRQIYKLKTGEIGGWLESAANLSSYGECWVHPDAMVFENGYVCVDAHVRDNARVFGDAKIQGYASVRENALVHGYSEISGASCISGNCILSDCIVGHDATITQNCRISNARISYATIMGNTVISGRRGPKPNKKSSHDIYNIDINAHICNSNIYNPYPGMLSLSSAISIVDSTIYGLWFFRGERLAGCRRHGATGYWIDRQLLVGGATPLVYMCDIAPPLMLDFGVGPVKYRHRGSILKAGCFGAGFPVPEDCDDGGVFFRRSGSDQLYQVKPYLSVAISPGRRAKMITAAEKAGFVSYVDAETRRPLLGGDYEKLFDFLYNLKTPVIETYPAIMDVMIRHIRERLCES
jgi:hypothetical protein